ncbi:MAG TPA: hypothetical protein VE914_14960 [Candidatus Angelobacter sp.]|nr:hypothetical protein [Candidatus Angelobacter sp.]
MGVLICETHGQQFIRLVSPALRSASIEHRSFSRSDLCKVRHVYFDGEKETWFWCDRDATRRFAIPLERPLSEDEYWGLPLPLEPVCPRCFDEWLKKNTIDAR